MGLFWVLWGGLVFWWKGGVWLGWWLCLLQVRSSVRMIDCAFSLSTTRSISDPMIACWGRLVGRYNFFFIGVFVSIGSISIYSFELRFGSIIV
jgi:hypothetical protein